MISPLVVDYYNRKITHYPFSVVSDVTPSAVHVGNIVQGARMAQAQGRELGSSEEESDTARKVGPQVCLLSIAKHGVASSS